MFIEVQECLGLFFDDVFCLQWQEEDRHYFPVLSREKILFLV